MTEVEAPGADDPLENGEDARFRPVEIEGHRLRRIDFDHPAVKERVVAEIASGVPVYYDRHWETTARFCRFLDRHVDLVSGRDVLVVGAGVGLEAVLVGRLCDRLWINDMAPVALELLEEQLAANGIRPTASFACSFGELEPPPGTDLVVACFVVYDEESAEAMERLLARAHRRGIPVLIADEDLGGHLSGLLARVDADVRDLGRDGATLFRLVG